MAIIKKKTWPEYFDLIISNKKRFDLRINDFNAKVGDILVLEEWNPKTKQYTGRKIEKEIDYVLEFDLDSFNQKTKINEKGLVVLQLKEVLSCKTGLEPNQIDKQVFEREIHLCQKLFKENEGKCCWGRCKDCGVPLLLHKLYFGEVIDNEEGINDLRKRLFE